VDDRVSGVLTEPVTWDLVSSEGLFSEFLVATILNGIDFESVGVAVDIMVLGKEIGDWVASGNNGESDAEDDLGVWDL